MLGRPGGTTAPCHGRPYEVIFIVLWEKSENLSFGPEHAFGLEQGLRSGAPRLFAARMWATNE